ncbi:uncharacterized protein [Nicotiana sylvestris]|uniref:uncharacterized protein n=1 Tax=Nicotiana sylvestris TaxID=4096 RepID=UPI00388CAB51
MAIVDDTLPESLSHNHPLFLHSTYDSGAILIALQLTGSDNYSVWSRAMRIAILGRNKIGFIEGTYKKEDYGTNLADLWERCNAIVLSWIMNCVSSDLLSGIVYSSNACAVWKDMKERFDKVNGPRILQLHRAIATASQGTSLIATYFSKMRELWAEFDCLAPAPGCDCPKSREKSPPNLTPNQCGTLAFCQTSTDHDDGYISALNKANFMLMERESQRSMANVVVPAENAEMTTLLTTKGFNNQKPRKNYNVLCDYCKMKGQSREGCYKLIGYPDDFKFKKKFGGNTAHNAMTMDFRPQAAGGRGQDAFKVPPISHFTIEQYSQILKLLNKENVPEVSANMAGPLQWEGEGDW